MADDIRAAAQKVMSYFNGADMSDLETVVDPNVTDHQEMPGLTSTGAQRMRDLLGIFRAAFPDMHAEINDLIVEGDKAVLRTTMSGTHTGDFMGIPPTGKSFSIDAIDIMRFENGRAVEHWGLTDDAGMMRQLGLLPDG